ncbi:hypothetical protein [Flavimaricola marinus]|uniref:Restriction endonuclease n=1 Tax=Flavimaricola marinus TaxID=1819565 RepID=A0A238LG18_9RHOB|nr:hypothetical protein [Flavimaricola marinus]SMY08364.1 hypothetical protein LOM8899_02515 [Flavimaricola marinus]
MRVVSPKGTRGSLKWIQEAVEHAPHLLRPEALPAIEWVSPLAEDDYAEYRDAAFLDRLGLGSLAAPLKAFWPQRGPQWDALGVTPGGVVLVEAKAHVREFFSPPSQAGDKSLAQVQRAFDAVRADLGLAASGDWTAQYYQYANRIAFLWWLREQGIDAHLLFVSFLNDVDMGGPIHAETWEAVFAAADYTLGLPKSHRLRRFIHHVTPDVADLA